MDQKPEAIKQHIDVEREKLGENLQFLEHRVRTATDWRTWLRQKPLVLLALAFGGGLFLAMRANGR